MIIHLVLMNFDDRRDAEEASRRLLEMKDVIEVIRRVDVGMNFRPSDRAYDLGVLMEFDSEADLDAFRVHPAHEAAAEFYRARRSAVAICDFEV